MKVVSRGVAAVLCCGWMAACGSAPTPPTSAPTSVATTSPPTPTPAPVIHYPPKTPADLQALANAGNASAVQEFHSESVGLASCPQPKREVTVAASLTGEKLAEDLLAYWFAQQLNNPCGALVLAYHNQSEAGNPYTAGSLSLDVTGSAHTLTISIGPAVGAEQVYTVSN